MTKEKKYITGAFIIGILYRLLMGLQGIDSIDMGFCMTFYQNIFSHPEAMTFYFNYYLTGLIGGVWHLLFGQFGLLGFRVLETMTMTAAIWLLYLSFKPWFHSTRVAAVAIFVSFLFPSFVLTFHYDTLSFLLMSASVYAMSRWQQSEQQLMWLWVAGTMIGIAFFARIVNGSLAALVLIPFICGCLQSWKRGLRLASFYGGGILTGCVVVLALMVALGHWTYFMAAVNEAFGTFNGNESSALRDALPVQNSHTSSNLFSVYLKSYVNIGLQVLALAGTALFYGDAGHLPNKLKMPIRLLLLAILFVLVFTSQPISRPSPSAHSCYSFQEPSSPWCPMSSSVPISSPSAATLAFLASSTGVPDCSSCPLPAAIANLSATGRRTWYVPSPLSLPCSWSTRWL